MHFGIGYTEFFWRRRCCKGKKKRFSHLRNLSWSCSIFCKNRKDNKNSYLSFFFFPLEDIRIQTLLLEMGKGRKKEREYPFKNRLNFLWFLIFTGTEIIDMSIETILIFSLFLRAEMYFGWMTPFIQKGYRKPITERDVWNLDTWDQTETLIKK